MRKINHGPEDKPVLLDRLSTEAGDLCIGQFVELPLGLMVPDGGHACADLRWYCKDAQACTDRWTGREGKMRQRRS